MNSARVLRRARVTLLAATFVVAPTTSALAAPVAASERPTQLRADLATDDDEAVVARRRRKKKKAAPKPAPAEGSGGEQAAVQNATRQGPTRIEFDERLLQGQTNKANAIYLFQRRESALRSLVKKRQHFHDEIDEALD